MNHRVAMADRFDKEFRKLDCYTQQMIKAWIEETLLTVTTRANTAKASPLIAVANGAITSATIVLSAKLTMVN